MVGFSATRCATTTPTVRQREGPLRLATRHTTMVRMVRRLARRQQWAGRG